MKTSHSVSDLFFHLTFCTKRREGYNIPDINFDSVFEKLPIKVISWSFGGSKEFDDFNHIHILFESNIFIEIPELVRQIKIGTSKKLSQYIYHNALDMKCLKFNGWQIGYYIKSVGGNSIEKVKNYIKKQY